MAARYSIPNSICEVPKCEKLATNSIVVKQSGEKIQMQTNEFQHIPVCKEHKQQFESGKMLPFFNRLKNLKNDSHNRLFTRK